MRDLLRRGGSAHDPLRAVDQGLVAGIAPGLGPGSEEDDPVLPRREALREQELQPPGLEVGDDHVGVGVEDAVRVLIRIRGDADDLDGRILPQPLGDGVAQVPLGDQDEGADGAIRFSLHAKPPVGCASSPGGAGARGRGPRPVSGAPPGQVNPAPHGFARGARRAAQGAGLDAHAERPLDCRLWSSDTPGPCACGCGARGLGSSRHRSRIQGAAGRTGSGRPGWRRHARHHTPRRSDRRGRVLLVSRYRAHAEEETEGAAAPIPAADYLGTQRHALVIGIDDYADGGIPDLRKPREQRARRALRPRGPARGGPSRGQRAARCSAPRPRPRRSARPSVDCRDCRRRRPCSSTSRGTAPRRARTRTGWRRTRRRATSMLRPSRTPRCGDSWARFRPSASS